MAWSAFAGAAWRPLSAIMTASLQMQFAAFEKANPRRVWRVAGQEWVYIDWNDSGRRDGGYARCSPLVMLPGFFGVAGTDFLYFEGLASDLRLISLTYPAGAASVTELVEGLARFLSALGLEQVSLLGGSYSGYVAQVFTRRYPERVDRLILAQTGAPNRKRLVLAAGLVWLFGVLPQGLLRTLMQRIVDHYYPPSSDNQIFWRDYFRNLVNTLSKQAIYNRFRVTADYHRRFRFAPADLEKWGGQTLLLESNVDGMLNSAEVSEMRRLYPLAQRCVLPGSHTQSVEQPAEQIAAIRAFMGGAVRD